LRVPTFLIDTDVCIYLLTDSLPALSAKVAVQPAGSLSISAISLAELSVRYGERAFDAPELASLLAEMPILDFDEAAAKIYGALLFRRGSFDRLIAAHALSRNLILVTNNRRDFADVPRLKTENWTGS